MTQLLIYENAVPVSSETHRDFSVKTGKSYSFASKVNSVPLTAIEFANAAAEYPIVFSGTDSAVMPCVILGAAAEQNMFVNEDGSWAGKYMPAFIRRYPFVFANGPDNNLILHVDESFDGCNRDGVGERLFDAEGNQTQYLKIRLDFLQDYQARFTRTQMYCNRLKELDLLRPMEANFQMSSGERRSLSGFMTVDRDKFKALEAEQLAQMMSTDELECTFLHLFSLRHFGSIAERYTDPGNGAVAEAEQPAEDKGSEKEVEEVDG